jgi:hypothetical protein
MSMSKPVWCGLFAVLVGLVQPAAAPAEAPSVVFVARPDVDYVEYKITDADLRDEIATLKPGSYTKVFVPAARKLTIRLMRRDPFAGGMLRGLAIDMTVTPDMAGKQFTLGRTSGFWVNPKAVEEAPSDLSALAYHPDLTGTLALGSAADPYDRTFALLSKRGAWDQVSTATGSLELDQRQALYDAFKLDGHLAWGNAFPGLGWGSFQQGDWPAGALILVGEGTAAGGVVISGTILFLDFFAATLGGGVSRIQVGRAVTVMGISTAAWLVVRGLAVWRSFSYTGEFNSRLARSLDVTP